jgi:hypothetical protein
MRQAAEVDEILEKDGKRRRSGRPSVHDGSYQCQGERLGPQKVEEATILRQLKKPDSVAYKLW